MDDARRGLLWAVSLSAIVFLGFGWFAGDVLATSEIVTSDQVQNPYITLSTVIYKDTGELDTAYDYYAILVTVDDRQNRGPYTVRVTIWVPSYAEEVPANHLPMAGSSGEQDVTFTYRGIGFPMHLGGDITDWYTGMTATLGILRYFQWYQHQGSIGFCPSDREDVFVDYGQYAVGVRVPEGASVYGYAGTELTWNTFWACSDGNPSYSHLEWSFASYNAGGSDNYRSASIRGVPDAPDSGTQLTIASTQVSGIIGGLTGQGDISPDTIDRYQRSLAYQYTLTVTLYVNGQNLDLCLETPGEICSRNSGATDETVSYYNGSGSLKYINIRVEGPNGVWGAYELRYEIAHR